MRILGISGKAGSGKSTLGELVSEKLCARDRDLIVRFVPFAKALRYEVSQHFGIPHGWTLTSEGKSFSPYCNAHHANSMLPNTPMRDKVLELYEPGMNIRRMLQVWGQYRRSMNPDYWLKKWYEGIVDLPADLVIVDDIRFPNEARAVDFCGGLLVRLEHYDLDSAKDQDISETALDGAHFNNTFFPGYGELGEVAGHVAKLLMRLRR
jgi:molybdopterin-guanine dinucleotide biosynthesis protein